MSAAVANEKRVWTTEELLAMPDDGKQRFLVHGELKEIDPEPEGNGMTIRNRVHGTIEAEVTGWLWAWCRQQSAPRPRVACGEIGFRLASDPDTTVGMDAAVVPPAMAAAHPPDTTLYEGAPLLAVEVLSPSDTQQGIADMVRHYLGHGVPVVWVLNPTLEAVSVHRRGRRAVVFDSSMTLTGDPELPGFSVPVAALFE